MLRDEEATEIRGVLDTPYSAADLSTMIDNHMPYFEDLWERGRENELYMKGENLSKKKRKAYSNQSRSHFPIPNVADKLSRIISAERNSRTYAKAEATKPDSEVLAELVTLRFRKIEKDSNMEYTESEVYQSGVGAIYGVIEWVVKYNKKGEPVLTGVKRDYSEVMWDSNARDYDKGDGNFMAHRHQVYRRDIERDYGKKLAEQIEINTAKFGREANENWGISNSQGKRDMDVIYIYRVWVKVLRDEYHVVFGSDDFTEYSQADAEKKERMLKLPYIITGQDIPQSDIVHIRVDGLDYYETTLNEILKYQETDLEDYPMEIYQSFQFEDMIWCMTDLLKPGNKLMDKLLAQIDYAIGADIKNGWEIVIPWLAEGYSMETAIKKVKLGEPLPVIRPGALRAIPQKGANPQWMELMGILDSMSDKYTGGDLFSGVQKGKQRESTQSVAMKLKQQEMVAFLFMDNLQRWKRGFFKKGLWYLKKYDTAKDIQKIHGSALTPEMIKLLQKNQIYIPSQTEEGIGYVRINEPTNQLTILKNADVDISIVEENISDTSKDAQYQRMMLMDQTNPLLNSSPTWLRLKLEKMDVSYEDRMKIAQEIAQARKENADKAEKDKQMDRQKEQEELNVKKAAILVQNKPTPHQMVGR